LATLDLELQGWVVSSPVHQSPWASAPWYFSSCLVLRWWSSATWFCLGDFEPCGDTLVVKGREVFPPHLQDRG
jgi:hypothetical protein